MLDQYVSQKFGELREVAGVYKTRLPDGQEYWVLFFGDKLEKELLDSFISAEMDVLDNYPSELVSFHYFPAGSGLSPETVENFGDPVYERGVSSCR